MSLNIDNLSFSAIKGLKITIMGLGLNGGGLASAEFFAAKGAEVTVTDLRSREILAPSIEKLKNFNIRYVLEKHEMNDFKNADIVIKKSCSQKKFRIPCCCRAYRIRYFNIFKAVQKQ